MTRSYIRIFIAAAVVTATAAPAFAEVLQQDKRNLGRSDEAKQNDKLFDQQFRARGAATADPAEAKADPWAGVRQQPAQPAQPASATKKITS